MTKVLIPVYTDFDYDTYEVTSDRLVEGIFYDINCLTPFIDNNDNLKGTEINSGGIIYISPLSISDIDYKITYNNQEL